MAHFCSLWGQGRVQAFQSAVAGETGRWRLFGGEGLAGKTMRSFNRWSLAGERGLWRVSAGKLRLGALTAFVFVSVMLSSAPSAAQDSLRAAAIVNDEVVSILDVVMRIRLAIIGAGVEDSPQMRERIGPQILQRLIDERLQLQEAKRLDIAISEEEVDQAIVGLARQNKLGPDQFLEALQNQRISPDILKDQIRAELAWRSVVRLRLASSITVSSKDIDGVVKRIMSDEGRIQYRVSEIFLTVPDASQEGTVRQNVDRLMAQIRGGANFAGLARQFSQANSASLGGDLGWIDAGKLSDPLSATLKSLKPGQLSQPVRTVDGFAILFLREVRERVEEEIDREAIEQGLRAQRVDQRAQRSLQELRRSANIDIRI